MIGSSVFPQFTCEAWIVVDPVTCSHPTKTPVQFVQNMNCHLLLDAFTVHGGAWLIFHSLLPVLARWTSSVFEVFSQLVLFYPFDQCVFNGHVWVKYPVIWTLTPLPLLKFNMDGERDVWIVPAAGQRCISLIGFYLGRRVFAPLPH